MAAGNSAHPERIEIEADARHADLVISHLGLKPDSKGITIPSTKVDMGAGEKLDAEQHSHFRSIAMRASFLAEDRADLKFPTKELARCMSAPTTVAWEQLRRLGRYLIQAPRVVQHFVRQRRPKVMTVHSDSDHAGCLRTRRSTSATVVMLGQHCLRVASTTQIPIALSSGESEWYALVKSATVGLGLRSSARDFQCEYDLELCTDSSAANGIGQRRGAGGVRHIETRSLWLQHQVTDKRLKVKKIPKEINNADLPTKHQDGATIQTIMARMGYIFTEGKSNLALGKA